MGIKLSSRKAFEDYLNQAKEVEFKDFIINELNEAGKVFIQDARTKQTDTFENRTTRLRNSIGYVIAHNGLVIKSDFESFSISGIADEDGKILGLQYATELAQQTKEYALICVAGADYGLYVEAKGYDVITGSVLTLQQQLLKKW